MKVCLAIWRDARIASLDTYNGILLGPVGHRSEPAASKKVLEELLQLLLEHNCDGSVASFAMARRVQHALRCAKRNWRGKCSLPPNL